MEISVIKEMTVENLAKAFSHQFPFLKIEIYYKGEEMHLDGFHTLNNLCRTKKPEDFTILPTMTVEEVEQLFWEKLGLQTAIFQKIDKTWLSTNLTNNLTLERQNQLSGNIFCSSINHN